MPKGNSARQASNKEPRWAAQYVERIGMRTKKKEEEEGRKEEGRRKKEGERRTKEEEDKEEEEEEEEKHRSEHFRTSIPSTNEILIECVRRGGGRAHPHKIVTEWQFRIWVVE
jgi:hypothetical protein